MFPNIKSGLEEADTVCTVCNRVEYENLNNILANGEKGEDLSSISKNLFFKSNCAVT